MSTAVFIIFMAFLISDVLIRGKGEHKTPAYILWDVFRTIFLAILCSYIFYQMTETGSISAIDNFDIVMFLWRIINWIKDDFVNSHTLLALYVLCFYVLGLAATIYEYDFIADWKGLKSLLSYMFPYITAPILALRWLWIWLVLKAGNTINPEEGNNPDASRWVLLECVSYLGVMLMQFVMALILLSVVYSKPLLFLIFFGGYCLVFMVWTFIFKVFSAASSLPGGKLEEYNNMKIEKCRSKRLYIIVSDISVLLVFLLTFIPFGLWFYEMWYI